ncbi:hypothetical protein KSP40_PGU013019 [Platanthera guangdongensis]|uniref:Phospholipid/glycerol acyltransferase domain-containing protein n=1 Tax=Platanthera guangdongensis TaxID=2320717 RepID=A0ABR2LG46_9ASPA
MVGLGADLDHLNIDEYLPEESIQAEPKKLHLNDFLDISPTLTEAAGAIIDDSFTRCFKSNPPEPWNWNIYLFPLWCLGVMIRYGLLFPLRLAILTAGWIVFFAAFLPVHFLWTGNTKWRCKIERKLVEMMCGVFVASWTGVVKYHGPRPSRRPQQVFVANHTSMIDFIILEQMTAFAVIMQKHPGWVGFIQKTILESVGCIWFNRTEAKDREIVARKLREHTQGADNNPLLIFPEGTCVNNQYTGAFELGCAVCPVAIKYNKIFVDAFWNSKKYGAESVCLKGRNRSGDGLDEEVAMHGSRSCGKMGPGFGSVLDSQPVKASPDIVTESLFKASFSPKTSGHYYPERSLLIITVQLRFIGQARFGGIFGPVSVDKNATVIDCLFDMTTVVTVRSTTEK